MKVSDHRVAVAQYLAAVVGLMCALVGLRWGVEGVHAALLCCAAAFLAWVGVTALLAAIVLLAARTGRPSTRVWEWLTRR